MAARESFADMMGKTLSDNVKTKRTVLLCGLVIVLFVLLCFIAFALLLRSVFAGDMAGRDSIFNAVKKSRDELTEYIGAGDFESPCGLRCVKDVAVHGEDMFSEFGGLGAGYLEFYCGGKGWASGTEYSGFYYISDEDAEHLYDSDAYEKTVEGDRITWREKSPGGDNEFTVEKICDGFWYYNLKY